VIAFYFFAAVVVWLGVLSLRSGFRFARYVEKELARPLSDFTPFVSVIAPCRGLEDGLRSNISALFEQDYPAYEIIFVSDRADDPAFELIQDVRSSQQDAANPLTQTVVAGAADDSGQKVHNLRVAVATVAGQSEVLVFVDTDARPHADWLRTLVAPLANESVGASTGYRWFIPEHGGMASQLRSVWNASIASALGDLKDKNFCWGGSTAIRRLTFETLQVNERWRGTVSDDFTLTRVLQEAKLPIHFVPACLVASIGDCTFAELLEFTNRQLKITRNYAAHLWKPLLIGSLLFCAIFFGGIILIVERAIRGLDWIVPLALVVVIYALGAAKAYVRFEAVSLPLAKYQRRGPGSLAAHLVLWPFASALYLSNAITAGFSRRIKWRGITYELKSPGEAVIIARDR
jgi:cellulose synthase/poly-beta-1,6-N-acetylglucosamine synthase-like glycosyltransferase